MSSDYSNCRGETLHGRGCGPAPTATQDLYVLVICRFKNSCPLADLDSLYIANGEATLSLGRVRSKFTANENVVVIENKNQIGLRQSLVTVEQRRHPRFKLDVDIELHTRGGECLRGRTVDISESGVSALLKIEVAVDSVVQLDFSLPDFSFALEKVSVLAVVRQRNAFRYGFQFADPDATREVIRRACERLAPCP